MFARKNYARGAIGLLAAAATAVSLAMLGMNAGTAGAFGINTLKVGNVVGPDMPLAWKSTITINEGTLVPFQWTTTDSNVTARWVVTKTGSTAQIASGVIATIPQPGKYGRFNIDFRPFVPATAPSGGLKYDVVVSTYRKVSLTIVGRPPVPLSTSSKVMVAYVKPGAPVKFDDDMGYSRRQIKIDLHTLNVGDEDDPLSSDEPYVIMVKFRFRTLISSAGKPSIQGGTLQTSLVGSSTQNNLRGDDNWCDEDDDPYNIQNAGLSVNEHVPTGQLGWVVGAAYIVFEEDAFSSSTAKLVRDKILAETQKALQSLNFTNVNTQSITDAVTKKILGEIRGSFKLGVFGLGGFLSGLAQAADPDDIAGFNTVIAFTAPGGKLAMTSGQPPASANEIITQSVPVSGPQTFTLSYPAGDIAQAPGNARYQGQMSLVGTLSTKLIQ